MNKFQAFLTLLQKGGVVADPASWKKGQVTTNVLSPFIIAVAALAGQDGIISQEAAIAISGGVVAVVNVIMTVVSTDKIGLLPGAKPR